jgi:MSHA biogenesis protein MshM
MENKMAMSQVLDEFRSFFGMQELPFSLVPNTQYYVGLPSHNECFSMLLFAIASGDGFIKVTGEVGTGKTLLCRRLLNCLDEQEYYSAYIPNPKLNPLELKRVLAHELKVPNSDQIKSQNLLNEINNRLLALAKTGKKVVLVIDEAQAFPSDSLEELRLLSNLETETDKLMQIVLFGQPELDELLTQHEFRQLRQRITFSHCLNRLNKNGIGQYIHHRMMVAGYMGEPVFDGSSIRLLHKATQGTPRLINIVCAKALLIAFSKGQQRVRRAMIKTALIDTEGVNYKFNWLMV